MTEFERMVVKANRGRFRGAQTALAKKLKISQGTVSRWCSGSSTPDPDIQPKLATALGISQPALMALFSTRVEAPPVTPIRKVPVIGIVHANRFHVSYDGPPLDWIPNFTPEEESFALRITGDCMEPTLHGGEDAYCYPRRVAKNKDVVVVQLDGESTISRLRIIDDIHYLVPDNKKYPREKLHPKMTIRAVVDGAYRRRL